jgi:hypothetical protein
MSMITMTEQAKASAQAFINDRNLKVEEFSETVAGHVVTCVPVCSSNAFETTIGHVKMTWKIDGKRSTGAAVTKLFKSVATPEELAEMKREEEQAKWLKKFGF